MKMPEYKPPTVAEELESRRKSSQHDEVTQTVDRRILSEDAAGVEAEMFKFSDLDDGAGSNVMHGDLSVLRMTERSRDGVLNQDNCWPRPVNQRVIKD